MPELPEVETIVNDLRLRILGKKIRRVEVRLAKIVTGDAKKFNKFLRGQSFNNIQRRGKLLIFKLAQNSHSAHFLLVHLRMTGQLIYRQAGKLVAGGHGTAPGLKNLPHKQTHVIFTFTDGTKLFFNDQRQFGRLQIVDKHGLEKILAKYGVEPLSKNFIQAKFAALVKNRQGNIKALLLKQDTIAGIGNIYADEILFGAKISPRRNTSSLRPAEVQRLWRATRIVLTKAIKYRGTTFNDYVDAYGQRGQFLNLLKVYHRTDELCSRCRKTKIIKTKIAGRGTCYCPYCQK